MCVAHQRKMLHQASHVDMHTASRPALRQRVQTDDHSAPPELRRVDSVCGLRNPPPVSAQRHQRLRPGACQRWCTRVQVDGAIFEVSRGACCHEGHVEKYYLSACRQGASGEAPRSPPRPHESGGTASHVPPRPASGANRSATDVTNRHPRGKSGNPNTHLRCLPQPPGTSDRSTPLLPPLQAGEAPRSGWRDQLPVRALW